MVGSPIEHSLSPVLHGAAYRELGLTGWTYERFDRDADGLAELVGSLGPEWAGLSVTMPGKRAALPNARVLIHQPSTGGVQGQVSDLEIQAAEIERMRRLMETTLGRHTGKDADVIRKDTDRDKILTAEEAKYYGIIDTVFEYRKLSARR